MKKIIHNLRNKTHQERRHILHLFTFFGAVIMLVLWSFSLGKTLGSPDTKAELKQDLQPFSELKANIVDGYDR